MINDDNDFELITEDAIENAQEADLLVRVAVTPPGYYILFNKATGSITAINPVSNTNPPPGTAELHVEHSNDLDSIFSNKFNIEKLKVKYDLQKKIYILTAVKDFSDLFVKEFVVLDIKDSAEFFIDIKFNIVSKVVYFKPNFKNLNLYLSTNTPEYVLELTNSKITFYVFDQTNPTMLYDRYDVNIVDLIKNEHAAFKADWLDLMRTTKFQILTSNVGLEYNIVIDQQYVRDHLDYEITQPTVHPESPTLRLIITDDFLELQSLIENPENFKIEETLNLYLHKQGEPDFLLRKYVINRNDLVNQNRLILDGNDLIGKVSAVCDSRHINVETIYE